MTVPKLDHPKKSEIGVFGFDKTSEIPCFYGSMIEEDEEKKLMKIIIVQKYNVKTKLPFPKNGVTHLGSIEEGEIIEWKSENTERFDNIRIVFPEKYWEVFKNHAVDSENPDNEVMGFFCGYYEEREFIVSDLVFPKQIGQKGSVEVIDEKEFHSFLHVLCSSGLISIAWFHTHPKFLSIPSVIDVSTQSRFQHDNVLFFGGILAPTDPKCKYRLFRVKEKETSHINRMSSLEKEMELI